MTRVLVLRPEPGASATVERARALGLDATAVPLFEIEALAWTAPDADGFDGLLLTSSNAVRSAGDRLRAFRALPAYAVGEATAEAARDAGLDLAAVGDGGVERLLGSIAPGLRLLHLCGEHRQAAAGAPQQITALPVYRAKAVEQPNLDSVAGAVAMIHSPRAGRRFAELVRKRGSTSIAAISPAAAEATGAGWAAVEWVPQPSDDALLALAARLCNKPPPK